MAGNFTLLCPTKDTQKYEVFHPTFETKSNLKKRKTWLVIFVSLGRVVLLVVHQTPELAWTALSWAGKKQSCSQALLSCQTTTSQGSYPVPTLPLCRKGHSALPQGNTASARGFSLWGCAGCVLVFGHETFWPHCCDGREEEGTPWAEHGEQLWGTGKGLGGCSWGAVKGTGLPAALAEVRAGGHGSSEAGREAQTNVWRPSCPAARQCGHFLWDSGEAPAVWVRRELLVHPAASFKPHMPW